MTFETNPLSQAVAQAFEPGANELLLHTYAEDAYLDYSMAVVKDRALAQVQDGLKPVHKRILYTFKHLGISHDSKPVKSARIVGSALAFFHPHGDASVYDAMVRMAQPFALRYPLITGQGNFGSRDGDSAAAMRYCFVAGTKVATAQGLVSIEEMVKQETRQAAELAGPGTAVEIAQVVETSKGSGVAVRWLYSGVHEVVEVATRNGHAVRCTPNEPFLVLADNLEYVWKRADTLTTGDRVCMRRDYTTPAQGGADLTRFVPTVERDRTFPLPERMSSALALLLGLVVAEGCLRPATNELLFSNSDREVFDLFVEKFKECFPGASFHIRTIPQSSTGFKQSKPSWQFSISSKWLFDFLLNLGWVGHDCDALRVPQVVMEGSSSEVAAFLRGYFEGDGSCSIPVPGNQERQLSVYSASRGLLEQVKLLLLQHFGVVSSKLGSNRDTWRMSLSGLDNILRFAQHVGFLNDRKNSRLPRAVVRTGAPNRTDILPNVGDYLRAHRRAAAGAFGQVVNEEGQLVRARTAHVPKSSKFPTEFSRAVDDLKHSLPLLSLSYPTLAAKLQDVLSRNYFYAEIEAVRPTGREAVYDLTVEGTHAFTANGFVVHNTEARLSPISSLLLDELGAGTVDFKPTYDGTQKEPVLLPARLPMLLLNGTMGIAVGMASNIPPHNLREVVAASVALLANPELTTAEVLQHMPGPDFPDGGQLISSPSEIQTAYEAGRGPLRLRARWVREDLARGQWQIVVKELPYQVSTKRVLEQIEVLSNPQVPAGKKALTQQQVNLKALALDFLERATDESGKDDPVRLVLVPRTSKIDETAMMAFLLANTGLEETFGVNCTMMGLDANPGVKGVVQMLREWCEFRTETVRRRCTWELEQAEKRMHILEGRLTVFNRIDQVIQVVRDAEDPKAALMDQFGLTLVQAEDILEMRLRALNKLEGLKLEKEFSELQREAKRLRALLASSTALRKLVSDEVTADGLLYGDDRRTLIKHESRAAGATTTARAVVDEALTLIVSKNLWVRAKAGHGLDRDSFGYKPGDAESFVLETRSTWPVVFLDSLGRTYSVQASEVPAGRGDGAPLSTLIDIQANGQIVWACSTEPEQSFLFAGRNGYGFCAPLKSCVASKRAGKAFLTLDTGEAPMAPLAVPAIAEGPAETASQAGLGASGSIAPAHAGNSGSSAGGSPLLATGSSDGRLLLFPVAEVKTLAAGGKGVMLMVLDEGQELTAMRLQGAADKVFAGTIEVQVKGEVQQVPVELKGSELEKHVGHRARKGCQLPKKGVLRD